ncbi:unnamed protein product [Schistocephalus solidus]|uniref:C2H2-type domain-containing protein n=1 Tax=Schistocephalus solidus TaxID=70667 RepID=A0A183SLK5_SCHSO|nr:unnamed protein product [Schistocephalus solidus]
MDALYQGNEAPELVPVNEATDEDHSYFTDLVYAADEDEKLWKPPADSEPMLGFVDQIGTLILPPEDGFDAEDEGATTAREEAADFLDQERRTNQRAWERTATKPSLQQQQPPHVALTQWRPDNLSTHQHTATHRPRSYERKSPWHLYLCSVPHTEVLERTGILSIHAMLRQVQLRWSGHLDSLKKSLKQLQINPATWEDLAQDRPAWKRSVKTGSAIYEANRIAAAKAKRAARKSPAPRTNTANAQALPTCPRCQRIFRARIGLVGHLRTQCTNNPTIPISTSNSANPPSDSPTFTPGINSITPTIIETT